MKQAWASAIREFTKNDWNVLVTKNNFSRVFKGAWETITGDVVKVTRRATNAFRRSGIFPFDHNAVDYSRLVSTLNPIEERQELEIHNLVLEAVKHDNSGYTLSGSGKVDENETIVEPAVAESTITTPAVAESTITTPAVAESTITTPAVAESMITTPAVAKPMITTPAVAEPAYAKQAIHEPAGPSIRNRMELQNEAILTDPNRVTEVDPNTGMESICVQPHVALKTEDRQIVGTVPAVMIPVKRGA